MYCCNILAHNVVNDFFVGVSGGRVLVYVASTVDFSKREYEGIPRRNITRDVKSITTYLKCEFGSQMMNFCVWDIIPTKPRMAVADRM